MQISIHALREEGDRYLVEFEGYSEISIHALREEGDQLQTAVLRCHSGFLSTPSARRATKPVIKSMQEWLFLSTPSARRATYHLPHRPHGHADFYPRPPRGGRQLAFRS